MTAPITARQNVTTIAARAMIAGRYEMENAAEPSAEPLFWAW